MYVIRGLSKALLSREHSAKLQLIKSNEDSLNEVTAANITVDGLVELKRENEIRVPIPLMDKVKEQLVRWRVRFEMELLN